MQTKRLKWKMEYTAILYICGIFANFFIAFLNGILGFFNHSAWQGTMCAYYLFLMLLKLALLFGCVMRDCRYRHLKKYYLYVSIAILVLNCILGGMVYLMATDQGTKHYPGYLIYGVAFYAFCKIIAGVINLVKAGKRKAPFMLAMKSIGLVDGLVSILMLEIALLDTFGNIHFNSAKIMMIASGTGAWLIAAAVGVLGIRWYVRRM